MAHPQFPKEDILIVLDGGLQQTSQSVDNTAMVASHSWTPGELVRRYCDSVFASAIVEKLIRDPRTGVSWTDTEEREEEEDSTPLQIEIMHAFENSVVESLLSLARRKEEEGQLVFQRAQEGGGLSTDATPLSLENSEESFRSSVPSQIDRYMSYNPGADEEAPNTFLHSCISKFVHQTAVVDPITLSHQLTYRVDSFELAELYLRILSIPPPQNKTISEFKSEGQFVSGNWKKYIQDTEWLYEFVRILFPNSLGGRRFGKPEGYFVVSVYVWGMEGGRRRGE